MPVLATDDAGRYRLRVATSGFIVEIVDFELTLVRVRSPVAVGLTKSVELLETINALNGNGLGLRVFFLDDNVILATDFVAETLDARNSTSPATCWPARPSSSARNLASTSAARRFSRPGATSPVAPATSRHEAPAGYL